MKTSIIIVLIIAIGAAIGLYGQNESLVEEPVVIVTNFEECVAAGNPVMESYPRQCNHDGENFVEEIDEPIEKPVVIDPIEEPIEGIACDPNNRPEACTMQYEPVCGLVQVQCITTPCDPVPQTFGNGCSACGNQNVISYTQGECEL